MFPRRAGWLEIDTVALCGGSPDDRHLWILDAVDIRTDWTEQRVLENRGQHCTLAQVNDVELSLPVYKWNEGGRTAILPRLPLFPRQ